MGQTKKVEVYHLVARDTIEERVCRIKREKYKVVQTVLDGGETGEDFSALDALIKEIKKGKR